MNATKLDLNLFQRTDANDTCPANDAPTVNADDTNDLRSLTLAEDALISAICADFSRSTKMNFEFKDIQKMLHEVTNQFVYRIVPFHKIRWMSRANTIKRLLKLLQPLLIHYENLKEYCLKFSFLFCLSD